MALRTLTDPHEQYEALATKTAQLHALLEAAYGGGADNFSELSQETRDRYLWACADLASDCEELVQALGPAVYRPAEVCHG
jgi:hypothetical protein